MRSVLVFSFKASFIAGFIIWNLSKLAIAIGNTEYKK